MQILKLNQDNQNEIIVQAVKTLQAGGMIVYPTETCYGLGVDATNQQAVNKLLSYKARREGKPLSVLVDGQETAEKYVELNSSAKNFYQNFLPGPITVISKSKGNLASGIASELGTLGIRISSHPFAQALPQKFGKPITATSANPSYKKKPYSIDDLLDTLSDLQKQKIDLIIDAGVLPRRKSSTVIDTTLLDSMVLRQGDIEVGGDNFLISKYEDQTKDLAQRLCLQNWNEITQNGLVLALVGDLGVGKTIFAKGVGKFLQISDEIVSPSYTLVNEYSFERYQTSGTFYHLDPWRLEKFEDFLKLGFENMLMPGNVICIEWASKYLDELKEICRKNKIKMLTITFSENENEEREIRF